MEGKEDNDTVFLIEKSWYDSMENRNFYGFEPYGFVRSEDEAKRICEEGGVRDRKPFVGSDKKLPVFRYKRLTLIKD